MKHVFRTLLFAFAVLFVVPFLSIVHAATEQQFLKATVITIEKEGKKDIGGTQNIYQQVQIRFLDGTEKDTITSIEYGGMFVITEQQKVKTGDTVIIEKTTVDGKTLYRLLDKYRLTNLYPLLFGFFALVILMSGRKGVGAIAGMIISLFIILQGIVPQILAGTDALLVSIIGSIIIMVITMYLAHGFNQQTSVALLSTCITLLITGVLAVFFVKLAHLTGLGSEDMYTLQQGFKDTINFQGLLLGGIIIGALGVLDDVTTTQTTTIHELAIANPKYGFQTLVEKGMHIGRTHIVSLVNTLVLAYAGASIGVFIFLILGLQQNVQPLWVILNSEAIIEEIIRTLAGSTGLILGVPITTLLAAFFAKYSVKIQ